MLKEDYPVTPSDGVLDFSVRGQYYPLETSPEYKHSLAIGILFRFYNQLLSEVYSVFLCFCLDFALCFVFRNIVLISSVLFWFVFVLVSLVKFSLVELTFSLVSVILV